MTDKEWLGKLETAYKAYPYPSLPIEQFMMWLYKQYGIVPPKEKNEDRI